MHRSSKPLPTRSRPARAGARHRADRLRPSPCSLAVARAQIALRSRRRRDRLRQLAAGRSMPICCGAIALGVGQVLIRGEAGMRALFLLPAVLFTVAMVIFPTLFGLYIALHRLEPQRPAAAASSTASTISGRCWHDPYFWNALRQHGVLRAGGAGRICDRLRPGAAAQRRHPRPQILPRRVPDAVHAEPGRGQLDDRQIDDGIPLRPGGAAGPASRLGEARLLRHRPGSPACRSWRSMPGSSSRS